MADFVFNIAKGRTVEFYNRVQTNSPATAQITLVVVNTTALDATLVDYDTLAEILGDVNTAEVTNTNYARQQYTDNELAPYAPDDANDRTRLDLDDQTWTAVGAGDAWTDAILCYDELGTGIAANMIPLTCQDFAVTPSGVDVTIRFDSQGWSEAA